MGGKLAVALVGVCAAALLAAGGALAAGTPVYDSVPAPVPGNVPSQAFQATQTSEFGDQVTLAGTNRLVTTVDVLLSSWGCESGAWFSSDCVTAPGATFTHPITVNLYNVGSGGAVGSLIATQTVTATIPYRPSADVACSGGRWSDGTTCFSGKAAVVSVDFTSQAVTLPDTVIVGVAYNTSGFGASPLGYAQPCNATPQGCPYDSLNVGLNTTSTPSVGTDADPDSAYLDSETAGQYCDAGIGGTSSFRLDAGCWSGYVPALRINAATALNGCLVDDDTVAKVLTLLADCTVTSTVLVPDEYTLDGDGFSITAVDPAGGHFLGAVVKNGGTSANVTDLTVTASSLANICDGGDDRLRGILFEGASGSITNNVVTNVNQGPSGCQEGNAIEARNAPFDSTGADLAVTISGNVVDGYIKNGITANGSVAATITNNTVTGSGPVGVPLAAQNGIQIGFGATAVVRGNTISGNDYTPTSYVACGLLFYEADGVKASANTYSGNERDLCNYGRGGGRFNPNP